MEWLAILQWKMALMKNSGNVYDIQLNEKAGYNTECRQQQLCLKKKTMYKMCFLFHLLPSLAAQGLQKKPWNLRQFSAGPSLTSTPTLLCFPQPSLLSSASCLQAFACAVVLLPRKCFSLPHLSAFPSPPWQVFTVLYVDFLRSGLLL